MRGRSLVVGAVVVLVVGAAAAASEAVARTQTQRELTDTVTTALGADPATTSVDLGGGLLLPQLARGRLDEVRVATPRAVLTQGTFTDVTAAAADVSVRPPHVAAALTVTGTVPPEKVRQQMASRGLDLDLQVQQVGAADGSGTLRASGTVATVDWGMTLAPRVADGRLLVDVVAADLAGFEVAVDALPGPLRDAVSGVDVPLDGLPEGLALRSAEVVPGGVAVTLDGTDVALDVTG